MYLDCTDLVLDCTDLVVARVRITCYIVEQMVMTFTQEFLWLSCYLQVLVLYINNELMAQPHCTQQPSYKLDTEGHI